MPEPDDLAAGRIDDTDVALLRRLQALLDDADPVPADLALRSEIAITVAALEAEVARLVADAAEPALRGVVDDDPGSVTSTDTLTFAGAAASLTVLVDRVDDTRVILDGWVTPGGAVIEIHGSGGAVRTVASTDTGRFVVEGLATGPTWFVIRREDGRATVTPAVEL